MSDLPTQNLPAQKLPDHNIHKLAIVGVGLLGGSIGLAVRERFPHLEVIGVGRSQERLNAALEMGAITQASTEFPNGLAAADFIVLCTPVAQIARQAREAAAVCSPHAVITDVGSVKGAIVADVEADGMAATKFVGSHPMAGSEKTGCEHAMADLFVDRVVIVTPTELTDTQRLHQTVNFWRGIGSRVIKASPADHDVAAAMASHLPHTVAAALAAVTDDSAADYVATGWRDTTRIAAGDVQLWVEILLANRAATLTAIRKFTKLLGDFEAAIDSSDPDTLHKLLTDGKTRRDKFGE